jgi:hypothetical protein
MKKTIIIALLLITVIGLLEYWNDEPVESPLEAIAIERNEVGPVLHEIDVDNGKVIFYLRNLGNNQQLNAEYVKKKFKGWEWVYGGGHTVPNFTGGLEDIDNSWSYQYFSSTENIDSPFPMIFGVIKKQEINSISIQSKLTGVNQRSQVIDNEKYQLKIWYAFVSEDQGLKFNIRALTNDNKVLSTKEIDESEDSMSHSGTEKAD